MEAQNTSKHSGISSILHRDNIDPFNTNRQYISAQNMATAALLSPTSTAYSSGPPPPYSGPIAHSFSGLISPPESRRTSDNKTEPPTPIHTGPPQHRQSLPSLSEALNSGGITKSNPYVSPVSASLPSSQQQLPYSTQAQSSIPRTYSTDQLSYQPQPAQRHGTPPQPVHPQSNSFTRSDSISAPFGEGSRHPSVASLQAAPAPPNPFAPRYDSRPEQDPRTAERLPSGYTHHPPTPSFYSYGPSSQPHGQQPRHVQQQQQPQPYDGREERWKGKEDGAPFRVGLKRHLDVWDYENNLAQIGVSSDALHEWSRHYNTIAQEQQRAAGVVPDRMPSMESCKEMLEHAEKIALAVRRMQNNIVEQEHAIADQRMRDQGIKLVAQYPEDMSYDENQGFGGPDGKKRRGRAAPPGRCHSCNRAETPEWRRGPDGARTLCNACGLHYAKLTRKNTVKQSQSSGSGSSLRPKSMDGPQQL